MDIIDELRRDPARKIVYIHVEQPKKPEIGPRVEEVIKNKDLIEALKRKGIKRLFRFQHEAIKEVKKGENIFIVAGTGTGKTEAFLLPILEEISKKPYDGVKAVLIYPTKALARDQLKRILEYTSTFFGLRAEVLDGDTPDKKRKIIYTYPPQILITNPDMIHFSLQYSKEFQKLVSTAKYIVLDDAHVYTGVFGAHVHYVLRRLKRFTGDVQLIGASATIGNPSEFSMNLFGEESKVIYSNISRRAQIFHILVSPIGRSRLMEAISLLRLCFKLGLKTLVFVDSHRSAELLKLFAKRQRLEVELHRAGLRPEERERVEHNLRSGKLNAVIATPTLELGIDIGYLDAVILYNIPPTFSRYIQRTGRVGRRGQHAYVFTILGDDPISAFYERNPKYFFKRKVDPAYIDPLNEEVAKVHLLAMARDSPYRQDILSGYERKIVATLMKENKLRIGKRGFIVITRYGVKYLMERQNLRGIGDIISIVVSGGRKIGAREMPQALKELFPGAIYLHGGKPYLVLDLKNKKAVVKPLPYVEPPVITSPLYYTIPGEGNMFDQYEVMGLSIKYLELEITDFVYGYIVKRFPSMELIDEKIFEKEYNYSFKTKGLLIEFPYYLEWSEIENAEAFHAIEHALISAAQVVVGASTTDLGGVSFPSGHIYIYDSYPGGSGISKGLFERLEEALKVAHKIVSRCECEDGCPRCIYSPYCGNNNKILSRTRASFILEKALALKLYARFVRRRGRPLV